jgi:hypothetical protein
MDRGTLQVTGNEKSRYTSITRGEIPVNARDTLDARHNLWLVKLVTSSHHHISFQSHLIPSLQDSHQLPKPTCKAIDLYNDTNTPTHQTIKQDEALYHLHVRRRDSQSLAQDPRTQARRIRKSMRPVLGSPSQLAGRGKEQVQRDRMHVLHIRDQRGRLHESGTRGNRVPVRC